MTRKRRFIDLRTKDPFSRIPEEAMPMELAAAIQRAFRTRSITLAEVAEYANEYYRGCPYRTWRAIMHDVLGRIERAYMSDRTQYRNPHTGEYRGGNGYV